jgi:DNA-binding NtrC family response regulator
MKNSQAIKLFIVDDDTVFLKSLEIEFRSETDYLIETYATGELCLANLAHQPDVVILDYHLDGVDSSAMNGIATLDKIKQINPQIPVIILSSQDKIDVAVRCMRHKAFDYVVKSETAFFRMKKTIHAILKQQRLEKKLNWYMERM